jgi:hypothetical protein
VLATFSCRKSEWPEVKKPGVKLSECGEDFRLLDGDIIFQTSTSSQSQAVQLLTKSRYSHMGMVYTKDGEAFVFEASAKVKLTPVRKWIEGGEGGKFVVKRLADRSRLNSNSLKKMKQAGSDLKGRSYDPYFEWDDSRMYCSELVYKVYKAGGIELGQLQKVKDFDLSHPKVKKKMQERFGDDINYEETVISPASMFDDEKLAKVCSNY